MGKPFSVNINRFDPYKAYRFLVYFGTSTTPVAGGEQGQQPEALLRRDRVQGGRQRHHPQGAGPHQI